LSILYIKGVLLPNKNLNKTGNTGINVTFRRVRVTTVAADKQKVLHILRVCL